MPLPGIRCLGRGWLEWNRRCAVRLVWTILVLLVLPLAARAELVGDASFEGVVTSLAGVPAVQRGSIVSPLAPGAVILPGDSVRLAEGDEIRILLRTGRLLESRGPARLRLADEFGKEEWYSPIIREVHGERFGLYDTEMGRGPNIATNAFRQISPYNASVLFGKTECQWAAPAGYERFQVVIHEEDPVSTMSKLVVVLEAGPERSLVLDSERVKLESGVPYSWRVRGWDGSAWKETDKVFFRLLDRDASARIRGKLELLDGMRKSRQDAMPWVIGTILLMKERLYHEALVYVSRAISVNDLAPFPFTLRGRIYEEMNLPNLALQEYQVASRLGQ